LRLERDQHGINFAEVELLLEVSVAADFHGADFERRAGAFGFDLRDLRLGIPVLLRLFASGLRDGCCVSQSAPNVAKARVFVLS
jgi:hypothetical protein